MSLFKKIKINKKYINFMITISYIILAITIVYFNITGPIIIKLLPFLLLLGMGGMIIFNRTLLTSVFGFLISLCTLYAMKLNTFEYTILYSLFCFVSILLGEFIGVFVIKFFKSKSKKITEKNAYDISMCILIMIIGIYLNSYVNGNIYSYINNKFIVNNYIKLNYQESVNVKVYGTKYILGKHRYYSFNVKNIDKNDNAIYRFAVYDESKVIDGYKNKKIENKSKILKNEFYSQNNLSKYIDFNFDIKYEDLNDNITFYITKNVIEITEEELNKFTIDVNTILDDISNYSKFSNIKKMKICIKSKNNILEADIYNTNFYDKKYYLDSLETEFLDK
ncbi:MAG: hypothetical protein RR290_02825 [Clostridia bacterium]